MQLTEFTFKKPNVLLPPSLPDLQYQQPLRKIQIILNDVAY